MPEPKKLKKIDSKELVRICRDRSGGDECPEYNDQFIPKDPADCKSKRDYWAEFHSSRYGIEPNWVKVIYHRCDEKGWVFDTLSRPTTGLDLAYMEVETHKALELFKNTIDLWKLRSGYDFFKYLTKLMFDPFCTLQELSNLFSDLIAYQERNREHIICTGFPKKIFRKSYWFDWHLSRLYYLKNPLNPEYSYYGSGQPSAICKFNLDFWRKKNTEYFSIWMKDAVEIQKNDQIITITIKKSALCEFRRVSIKAGLNLSLMLSNIRGMIYLLKLV